MTNFETLDDGIIACPCGNGYLIPYENEIISDYRGLIRIKYTGSCPSCFKECSWTATYSLEDITIHDYKEKE